MVLWWNAPVQQQAIGFLASWISNFDVHGDSYPKYSSAIRSIGNSIKTHNEQVLDFVFDDSTAGWTSANHINCDLSMIAHQIPLLLLLYS